MFYCYIVDPGFLHSCHEVWSPNLGSLAIRCRGGQQIEEGREGRRSREGHQREEGREGHQRVEGREGKMEEEFTSHMSRMEVRRSVSIISEIQKIEPVNVGRETQHKADIYLKLNGHINVKRKHSRTKTSIELNVLS